MRHEDKWVSTSVALDRLQKETDRKHDLEHKPQEHES